MQRSRSFKVKDAIHTCLLLVICVWLLYQMNYHRKNSNEEEDIAAGIIKLGRRDLRQTHDLIVTTKKHEREDLEEEEEEEEDGRGNMEDEIDGLDQEEEEEEEEAIDFEDLNSLEMEDDENEDQNEEQSIREFKVVSRAHLFVSNSSSLIKTNPNATPYSSAEAILSDESRSMGLKILTRKDNVDGFDDYDDDDEEEDIVGGLSEF